MIAFGKLERNKFVVIKLLNQFIDLLRFRCCALGMSGINSLCIVEVK